MLLETLQRASQDVLGTLTVEPERVSASDAAKVFDAFVDLERIAAAGKTPLRRPGRSLRCLARAGPQERRLVDGRDLGHSAE